jgi:hypothetical protein
LFQKLLALLEVVVVIDAFSTTIGFALQLIQDANNKVQAPSEALKSIQGEVQVFLIYILFQPVFSRFNNLAVQLTLFHFIYNPVCPCLLVPKSIFCIIVAQD